MIRAFPRYVYFYKMLCVTKRSSAVSLVAHTRRILSFGTDLEALLDTNGRVPYDGVWTTSLSRDGFRGVYPATQGCTRARLYRGQLPMIHRLQCLSVSLARLPLLTLSQLHPRFVRTLCAVTAQRASSAASNRSPSRTSPQCKHSALPDRLPNGSPVSALHTLKEV